MAMPSLVLCGCGWLGKAIAKQHCSVFQIVGTTRHQDNFKELQSLGITPLQFTLGEDHEAFARQCAKSTVVLMLPPGRKSTDLTTYTEHVFDLITQLKNAAVSQLIYISTTSVYGDIDGQVTEITPPQPTTASGKAHVAIENAIRQSGLQSYTILRLAGLAGDDRHPANSLAGRTLQNGSQRVNLVYQQDVVKCISAITDGKGHNQTLHLCSMSHPTRKDYYPFAAQKLGKATVLFTPEESTEPTGKWIDASKTLTSLDLTLDYPSVYDMFPPSPS